MHSLLAGVLFAAVAYAGSITGVVLEQASGRPLARTVVQLERIRERDAARPVQPIVTRSGRSGQFVFYRIPPGLYIVTALKTGYFPASYGQRLPAGRGTPIRVTADSSFFAELRARHKGAITGRVLDENGIGTPNAPVVAYRARLPLRPAGTALSDDRGVYRIHSLQPGKYWVRSGSHRLEDGTGWLPTFGPGGQEVRDAKIHQVTVDADTAYADVNPEPGPLFQLEGFISCEKAGAVQISLSSETAHFDAKSYCGPAPAAFRFGGLAGGDYQLFAISEDGMQSAYADVTVQRTLAMNLALSPSPVVDVHLANPSVDASEVKLLGRRQNLSESAQLIEIPFGRSMLAPGYWEFSAHVPPGHFVESIALAHQYRRRSRKALPPDTAYEVFIEPILPTRLRITLSDQGGAITGSVSNEGNPVPGAPVFLWPADEAPRRSLMGSRERLTDTEGKFRFDSLPPGQYRVLATFDASEADAELVETARAPAVKVEAGRTATLELAVWVAPW